MINSEYPENKYIERVVSVLVCHRCNVLKPRTDFMKPGHKYHGGLWLRDYYKWCKQCRA